MILFASPALVLILTAYSFFIEINHQIPNAIIISPNQKIFFEKRNNNPKKTINKAFVLLFIISKMCTEEIFLIAYVFELVTNLDCVTVTNPLW